MNEIAHDNNLIQIRPFSRPNRRVCFEVGKRSVE